MIGQAISFGNRVSLFIKIIVPAFSDNKNDMWVE